MKKRFLDFSYLVYFLLYVGFLNGSLCADISFAGQQLWDIQEREQAVLGAFDQQTEADMLSEPERIFQLDQILRDYERLLTQNPEYIEGYLFYGKLLRKMGRREAAQKIFLKVDGLDHQLAVVKQQLGNYYAEEGNPEVAVEYFRKACELAPQEGFYFYTLGEFWVDTRQYWEGRGMSASAIDDQILMAFSAAHQLKPTHGDFHVRLGEAYFQLSQSRWPEALEVWKKIESDMIGAREKQVACLQLARIYLKLRQFSEAKAHLEAVTSPALFEQKQFIEAAILETHP
jgi:tetratricopeptide (TPR) repeat protein